MSINLDIVRKLIELACNNPNDNEANSAARRVCRMIKDDGFSILNSNPLPPRATNSGGFTNPAHDFMRRAEEEIRRRAREAADQAARDSARRQAEEQGRQAQSRAQEAEAARQKAAQEHWARVDAERRAKAQQRANAKAKYADTTYEAKVRYILCSICRKPKSTMYQGPEEKFMCAVCKFERDRKQRHAGYRK